MSTLGGVKYTSRREAQTKEAIASARLANAHAAQAREAAAQAAGPSQWDEILAAFEAGEAVWDDLSRMQKLQMPITYQIKCKAAQRKQAATAAPAPAVSAELKASDLSFRQKVTADRMIMQAKKAGVKLAKPEAYARVLAGHEAYADETATTN